MFPSAGVLVTLTLLFSTVHAARIDVKPRGQRCQSYRTTFPAGSVSPSSDNFVPLGPEHSYSTSNNGLELYLDRPEGKIHTKDRVNDKLSEGATINGTSTFLHGKVTFALACPTVHGVICAVILVAEERGEVDIELLGGDPAHFQTNVFVTSPEDESPHYGVFSSVEDVPGAKSHKGSIMDIHEYSIDWNTERIIWSVDGKAVRILRAKDTYIEGIPHYPIHPMRPQLGIWDASAPQGTSSWAKGPIPWESDNTPSRMTAFVRSLTLEC